MQCLTRAKCKTVVDKLFVARINGAFHNSVASVEIIVEQRMAEIFHVHTYLVCAAGFEYTLHCCYVTKPLQYFVMCNGFLAVIAFGISFKEFAKALMSAHMRDDGAFVVLRIAP